MYIFLGSIGWLGSISIAVNSLTGPAMVSLPAVFKRSGIIPTISTLLFVCILAALCSLNMANAISKVPGNRNFKKEVEFSEAFRIFLGTRWFIFSELAFFCCITCLNVSSIVDTAQVVDTFLGHWWPHGGTAALQIYNNEVNWIRWDYSICTNQELIDGKCLPFHSNDGITITAGNMVVSLVFFPLALLDLSESVAWQILGFLILLITSVQFTIEFYMNGLHPEYVSWWGYNWDDMLGVILFNFALVIAVPAWLYEREAHVDVPTVIYGSSALSVILYIFIGLFGACTMPHVSVNMLETMMSGVLGNSMQVGASIFAFAIIGLGIPLFSVLTRLNLTGTGLLSRAHANIFAVYLPFGSALILNDDKAIIKLLGWGGMIFTSLVAFILPLTLSLYVVKTYDYEGHIDVCFGWFQDRKLEKKVLQFLLILACLTVAVAIIDNIW